MKRINPEHIKAVLDLCKLGPFLRLLSMEVRELGEGYSKVEVSIETKHLNPFGGVHGGVYASLIDSATFLAVYCDVEENAGLITLDLKVDNLASVREGRLIVEGKRIKAGRRICLAEAAIFDGRGKQLAYGTSKQMVTPGLQTMEQVGSAMGYQPLPPKFIS